jgi:hypothetical protein
LAASAQKIKWAYSKLLALSAQNKHGPVHSYWQHLPRKLNGPIQGYWHYLVKIYMGPFNLIGSTCFKNKWAHSSSLAASIIKQ